MNMYYIKTLEEKEFKLSEYIWYLDSLCRKHTGKLGYWK